VAERGDRLMRVWLAVAGSVRKNERGVVVAKLFMSRLQVGCSVLVWPWSIVELRVEMQRIRLGGSGRRPK
jgi:hypothetical protein